MPEDWSLEEVEAAVADYFDMLAKELRGEPFNKADHNRQLQRLLSNRTKSSIERKHMNISAVLIYLGFPYINGYKPYRKYQQLLREVIEERLGSDESLNQMVAGSVEGEVEAIPSISDILSIQVDPPSLNQTEPKVRERPDNRRTPALRNYLEIEARNRSLGLAGEEMVIRFEHERLWRAGQRTLADRIEHVSHTKGDHLGYDIHSFDNDGRDRLIEVKTTRFGAMTPFFVSRNELAVSIELRQEYQLYRLFRFYKQPQLFVLSGSIGSTCELEPVNFSALPK